MAAELDTEHSRFLESKFLMYYNKHILFCLHEIKYQQTI